MVISHKDSTFDICKHCQLAEVTSLPFKTDGSRSTSPFIKVNCDLWGSAPVASSEIYR